MSPLRVGFVGCGSIAYGHLSRSLETGEVSIVALCDPARQKLEQFAKKLEESSELRPSLFTEFESFLERVSLDAVYVLTPHSLHCRQIVESLSKGSHVLVEKPMVTSGEEARLVIRKWRGSGKIVLLSYNFRYSPPYQYAAELIRSGELGKVEHIEALVCQDWVVRITESRRVWRFNPKLSGGGMLMDTGSHLLDAVLFVSGTKPLEVFAFTETRDKSVDIFSSVAVRYANGALGTISTVGNAAWRWELAIWLSRGALWLRDSELLVGRGEGGRYEFSQVPDSELPPPSNADENFVRAVLHGEQPRAGPTDGLDVALFADAIYRSASMGERVSV